MYHVGSSAWVDLSFVEGENVLCLSKRACFEFPHFGSRAHLQLFNVTPDALENDDFAANIVKTPLLAATLVRDMGRLSLPFAKIIPGSFFIALSNASSSEPPIPAAADRGVRTFASLSAVTVGRESYKVDSPSKGERVPIFSFSWDVPLTESLPKVDIAALASYKSSLETPEDALKENTNYALASAFMPSWVTAKPRAAIGGGTSAATQFMQSNAKVALERTAGIPGFTLPWVCIPELITCVDDQFLSPFCGEVKSAVSSGDVKDPRLFYELGMYCTLATLASLFRDVEKGHQRLYRQPPIAYGLAATSNVGYLVAFEWVGKQVMSIISQPFFLGSPRHKEAVESLPNIDFSSLYSDVNMTCSVSAWKRTSSTIESVVWTTTPAKILGQSDALPGRFYKFLRGSEFDESYLRRVRAVYTAYADACRDEADPMPSSLLQSQLLYGAGQLCVSMPFLEGRDAENADFDNTCVVEAIALAVTWLARHNLLFIDLRLPNVRIVENQAVLIDYDDMLVLPEPLSTFDSFKNAHCEYLAGVAGGFDYLGGGAGELTPIGTAIEAQFKVTRPRFAA